MKFHLIKPQLIVGLLVVALPVLVDAPLLHGAPGDQDTVQLPASAPQRGPNGGAIKRAGGLQFETIVSLSGIKVFVLGSRGQAISVERGRGTASLRVEGDAKRYRYDLLPDGKDALTARVSLSHIAGRQIQVEMRLIGLPGAETPSLTFAEVATVPASQEQLAATAIARQKICPLTGNLLGSKGQPVPVDVNGKTVYACCSRCVNAIQANPEMYAAGRPKVTVAAVVAADKNLIAKQANCPVMDEPLESMGGPIKVMVGNKPIFLCCKGCIKRVQADPAKYLVMVYGNQPLQPVVAAAGEQVRPDVFKVTAADVPFIAAQKTCPVMDEPLAAMGGPYRVHANGKAVYICCPGCAKKIAAEPQRYLDLLAKQGVHAPVIRP